jgi:AcrR family transcriptional regulator
MATKCSTPESPKKSESVSSQKSEFDSGEAVSTKPLTPRALRRIETTARIIDTSLAIITQEGIESLTIQRIAGELGYAVGALYRYFRSKDELLVAVQRKLIDSLRQDMDEAAERLDTYLSRTKTDEHSAALLRIMIVAARYSRFASEQPAQFQIITMILADPRELADDIVVRQQLLPALGGLLDHVSGLFDAAAANSALTKAPSARRTLTLWATIQGVLQFRKLERLDMPGLDLSVLLPYAVDSLLSGFGADSDRLKDARKRCTRINRESQK